MDLQPQHLEMIKKILAQAVPNVPVWAFGSRVLGTAGPFSDLDLVLVGEHPLPLTILANLKNLFSNSNLPFRVDLVDWADASPEFRAIIKKKYEIINRGL